jgi:hypothetical protein
MRFARPIRGSGVKGDEKMVAVVEGDLPVAADVSTPSADEESVEGRRVVAVAVTPMELLRPGSDLVRMIDGAGYVDLLLACENEPVADPSPVGVLGGGALDPSATGSAAGDDLDDCLDDAADELRSAASLLGLGELHLHRLALPAPLGAAAEPDLVAALSELVGFDPEPGVRVLAPAPLPGDPQRTVVDRAVRQIVQVYGLPLQRYRCLELSVVEA